MGVGFAAVHGAEAGGVRSGEGQLQGERQMFLNRCLDKQTTFN